MGRAISALVGAVYAAALLTQAASAANTPCSGRKGGISHCQGSTFICKDGSASASKKDCRAYTGSDSTEALKPVGDGILERASPSAAEVSVCFTPAQQCEPLIVNAIDGAQSSIRLQAYGLTALPVIHALQRASKRGVEVKAILDKSNDKKFSASTLLQAYGIPVWIDYRPAIAHNKVIVVDGHLTIGGSYNYTANAAKRNAENVTCSPSAPLSQI